MSFSSTIAQINQVCDSFHNDIQNIIYRFDSLRSKLDALEVAVSTSTKKKKLCRVCGVKCKKKCSICFTYYCGEEHQKLDWNEHKKVCKSIYSIYV